MAAIFLTRRGLSQSEREAIRPLPECGGLMYLAENLELEDASYPLCGVQPFNTKMPAPLKIAYVEITTTGGLFRSSHTARGHLPPLRDRR